jgi:oxygen-independent coproporphyrinogen-3 oxidase
VPLGIYISVPFCRTKCSYCNFASDVFSRAVFQKYVDRVCADIARAPHTAAEMGGHFESQVDSLYLGGGTPTVLEPAQLERTFAAVRCSFDVSSDAEVTVECAPGTLTEATLESLLRCGVNRVSLGVQSFVDAEAAAVGRQHKRITVLREIDRLRSAGIHNINIDLIAGLPHQTAESWAYSVAETIATGAPHVSVYMLEVDEDSRLGREVMAGGTRYHAHFVPHDEATTDFYRTACEQLASAGIAQYEISNFARERFESRHNLKYWTRQPYFGFGVDAHSMLLAGHAAARRQGYDSSRDATAGHREPGVSPGGPDAVRFAPPDSLERYMGDTALERTEVSRDAAIEESFFLGLRLNRGVNGREFAAQFGEAALRQAGAAIADLVACQLLERQGDSIRLTPRGRLLSNEVFERFMIGDPVGDQVGDHAVI